MPDDPFIGTWQLDPSTLNYQLGRPGRRATYMIESTPEGLRFTLDADDADGKPMHHVYGGKLDGIDVPLAPAVSLNLSRPTPRIIESVLKKDGKIVDRWTRTLAPDGQTLLITQHVVRASDGQRFANSALYRRVG
jgi:hypothetical protein